MIKIGTVVTHKGIRGSVRHIYKDSPHVNVVAFPQDVGWVAARMYQDWPISEIVISDQSPDANITSNDHYYCWNKPRVAMLMVRDGSVAMKEGDLTLEVIKLRPHLDTMTIACQYDKRTEDVRCEGCKK